MRRAEIKIDQSLAAEEASWYTSQRFAAFTGVGSHARESVEGSLGEPSTLTFPVVDAPRLKLLANAARDRVQWCAVVGDVAGHRTTVVERYRANVENTRAKQGGVAGN